MLGCVVDSVVFEYFIFHGVSWQLCSREVGIMQTVDVAMECWCNPGRVICINPPLENSCREREYGIPKHN